MLQFLFVGLQKTFYGSLVHFVVVCHHLLCQHIAALKLQRFLLFLPCHLPSSQHGEPVDGGDAILLYRHCCSEGYPAGWTLRRNT